MKTSARKKGCPVYTTDCTGAVARVLSEREKKASDESSASKWDDQNHCSICNEEM
jgi:hypothetical protein